MGLAATGPASGGGSLENRLFRFGFLCTALDSEPSPQRYLPEEAQGWGRLEVGDLVVHHHPETRLTSRDRGADRVVAIGEAFAAGERLETALDRLLASADDAGFFDALDSLSGRFALIVLRGDERWVLHDPIGSRAVYYRLGSEACVASHAELVALAFGHGPSAETETVIASEEYASRSVKYLPGDLTIHDGVFGLAPNNLLDLRTGRTRRFWPREDRVRNGFEEFASRLDRHLLALADHLRVEQRLPLIGVTGGIDTRVLLATYDETPGGLEGVTWMRRGGLDDSELEIIDAIVAAGSFEHRFVDVGEKLGAGRGLGALAKRNAGGFGPRSRITAHFAERYGSTRAAFIRGWGAEIVRGFYNLPGGTASGSGGGPSLRARIGRRLGREGRREIAVDRVDGAELLGAYDSSMRLESPSREHARRGAAIFEAWIARANMDDSIAAHGYDLSDVFYWEHRMGMWGASCHNELDPAVLSMTGFNSRDVYSAAFGLEPDERLTKELLRAVIARHNPAMAQVAYE
ncbi:hypothetical protein HJD18_13350 [Thermoleophilia bacterium SCSIO 60948]|nr:hypothetical protein HJD18_13350 [Thermoleophilia bacterium SCSIO 60948]